MSSNSSDDGYEVVISPPTREEVGEPCRFYRAESQCQMPTRIDIQRLVSQVTVGHEQSDILGELKKSRTQQTTTSIVAACAFLLAMASLSLAVAFCVLYVKDTNSNTSAGSNISPLLQKLLNKTRDFCLPCNAVRPYADLNIEGDLRRRENVCCFKSLENLLNIMNEVTANRINREIAHGTLHVGESGHNLTVVPESEKPVAFMVCCRGLSRSFVPSPSSVGTELRNWITDTHPSIRRNVGMQGGRLVIQRPGIYFVYAHVSFIRTSTTSSELGTQREWFKVYRYNVNIPNGGRESLLESVGAARYGNEMQTADFVGGTLRLEQGDQIFLTVSSVTQLSYGSKARTYLGLYKL